MMQPPLNEASSLVLTDQQAAAVAKAPRVTLADINNAIVGEYTFTADKVVGNGPQLPELSILTVCILVMKNGFVLIGKSAPASPENFNAELGAKFAREDAVRQLWPLMGYALRDQLRNRIAKEPA